MQLPSQFDRYAEHPELVKALMEGTASIGADTGSELLSLIATALKNPGQVISGIGNAEVAEDFDRKQEAYKTDTFGSVPVSDSTKEIGSALLEEMRPAINTVEELYNTGKARNPSEFEAVEQYAKDPRVKHVVEKIVPFAAPAFVRGGNQLLETDFKANMSRPRSVNKQRGFLLPADEAIKRTDAAGMTDLSAKLTKNYAIAQQMLANKESPTDIAMKTEFQVYPDRDGNDTLTWEVPGKFKPGKYKPSHIGNDKFKDGFNKGAKAMQMADYYEHDMLYDLVPELKRVKMEFDPNSRTGEGGYSNKFRHLQLGVDSSKRGNYVLTPQDREDIFSAGIHEITHAGQQIFDQWSGGSPAAFKTGDYADMPGGKQASYQREIADQLFSGRPVDEIIADYGSTSPGVDKVLSEIDNHRLMEAVKNAQNTQGSLIPPFDYSERYGRLFRNETSTDFQKYHQLAGEAQANMDMKRQNMTDQQRLENPVFWQMAEAGGVENPRLLRYADQQGKAYAEDTRKVDIDDQKDEMVDALLGDSRKINELSGEGIKVKKYGTNSTRIPSEPQQMKQGIDAHRTGDLLVSSSLLDSEKRGQLADIYRSYPALQNIDPLDTESALEESIDFMAGNLDDILTIMPDKWREKSMDWYNGYNRIAQSAAKKHGTTNEQAGSIIAVLSPQTDWNVNLTRADRIMDTWNTRQDFAWSPEMEAQMPNLKKSINLAKYKSKLDNIRGKKLKDLDSSEEKAMWIRAYDQAHNPREFHLYEPDGKKGKIATKKDGSPREANWASTSVIDKAVKILEDGSPENISRQLGDEHKVRSFNRNAADPSEKTTTTMDTHAIATALMQPLSGNKPKDLTLPYYEEVPQNFGVGMTDARTGMSGTYATNQDAYNKVAEKYGIPGRQVQSPTWEYGRALMNNQKTPAQKRYADHIWQGFADGKLTRKQAFDLIVKSFGKPTQP